MDAKKARQKYTGATARTYDEKRVGDARWQNEQDAVALMLYRVLHERGQATVLDIPVGTGRFFEIYRRLPVDVVGMDVSEDMLDEARIKLVASDRAIELKYGDILDPTTRIPHPDVAVCVRIMNQFTMDEARRALQNLKHAGARFIIVSATTKKDEVRSLIKKYWLYIGKVGNDLRNRSTDDGRFLSRKNPWITVHDRQKWLDLLEELHLSVEHRVLIYRRVAGELFPLENHIYLLRST